MLRCFIWVIGEICHAVGCYNDGDIGQRARLMSQGSGHELMECLSCSFLPHARQGGLFLWPLDLGFGNLPFWVQRHGSSVLCVCVFCVFFSSSSHLTAPHRAAKRRMPAFHVLGQRTGGQWQADAGTKACRPWWVRIEHGEMTDCTFADHGPRLVPPLPCEVAWATTRLVRLPEDHASVPCHQEIVRCVVLCIDKGHDGQPGCLWMENLSSSSLVIHR